MQVSALGSVGYSSMYSIAGLASAHNGKVNKSLQKISSGLGIVTAGDAPADLAISERLRALIGREDSASSNIENAVSYMQTSDSYMQNVQDTVGRMQELAVAANDGTKSPVDRQALQAEFSQLQQGITDTTSGPSPLAQFNGQALLQGDTVSVAIGPDMGQNLTMTPVDLSSGSSAVMGQDSQGQDVAWGAVLAQGAGGLNLSTQASAASALDTLSLASDHVSAVRATRGAEQARMASTLGGLRDSTVNTLMTESRIRDVDVAKELVNLVRFQTLGKLGRGMLEAVTGKVLGIG